MDGSGPTELNDGIRALLDGKNFASVATANPDGSPQSSTVWIDRDGDEILFSSTRHRRKVRNLERDPRASVSVYDLENPYHSVEVRGRVAIEPDPGNSLGNKLSRKYLGEDAPDDPPGTERVIVRVTPLRVNEFSG